MNNGLLSNKEFSEFQSVAKHLGSLAKTLEKNRIAETKENTINRQHIDAVNNLTTSIKTATDKLTASIDDLTKAINSKK